MSEFLERLFGGGQGIPSGYYQNGEPIPQQPFDIGPPIPPQPPGFGGLSQDQRTLLGIAALQDAFASYGGRQGTAVQGVMPVANLIQQQERQRRFATDLQRINSQLEGPPAATAPTTPQLAVAQPPSGFSEADETGGPFSRAAIGRSIQALGRAESSRPDAINQLGYAGQYQIGAPLAVDAGVYRPASGEIGTGGQWNGQWGGTFNIPGFDNVRTIRDFLQNPDAQRRAAELAMNVQAGRLDAMGLTGLIGQEVNGVRVTPEALLQGSWLGGAGGVQRFLTRGEDVRDANNTPISRWMGLQPPAPQPAAGQAAGGQPIAAAPAAAPAAPTGVNRQRLSPLEMSVIAGMGPEAGYRALFERLAPTRVGLQPVMVEETDANGQRVVVPYFPTQTGELRRGQLPPGARVAEGIRTVDMGTGTAIVGGRTGAQVGVVPRDTAGREREEQVGRAAGIAQAAAPGVIDATGRTIEQINAVLNHSAFSTATGVGAPLQNIYGTSAFDFGQRLEQIKGAAFLEAYNNLRGAGAITEQEGRVATSAIARINSGLAPADLRKALNELRAIAERGQERASQAAQGSPIQPAQRPQQTEPRLRFNLQTGRFE